MQSVYPKGTHTAKAARELNCSNRALLEFLKKQGVVTVDKAGHKQVNRIWGDKFGTEERTARIETDFGEIHKAYSVVVVSSDGMIWLQQQKQEGKIPQKRH